MTSTNENLSGPILYTAMLVCFLSHCLATTFGPSCSASKRAGGNDSAGSRYGKTAGANHAPSHVYTLSSPRLYRPVRLLVLPRQVPASRRLLASMVGSVSREQSRQAVMVLLLHRGKRQT